MMVDTDENVVLEGFNAMAKRHGIELDDPNPQSVEALFPLILSKEDLSNPETYRIAKDYVPVLSKCSYEKICQEPGSLENELGFVARSMQHLARDNVSSFLENTTLVANVTDEHFPQIFNKYKRISDVFDPLKNNLEDFHQQRTPELAKEREKFRQVLAKYNSIQELLEVPMLLDQCIRNQMYDEALDLLAFTTHMFQSHKNRVKRIGEDASIPLMDLLEEQVDAQRTHFEESLLNQLCQDIHLPACVKIIGYLRRSSNYFDNEESIRRIFLEQRGLSVSRHKTQIEKNMATNPVTCLRAASDLMRTHVFDIGMHYKALFYNVGPGRKQTNALLANWLQSQLLWFSDILESQLGADANKNLDANSLATILKCVMHCANSLKMLNCYFFPTVQDLFHKRMLSMVSNMLERAVSNFQQELLSYDWVSLGSYAETLDNRTASTYLVENSLHLMRHRPLAVFANEFIAMFNELRQCALVAVRQSILLQIKETCACAVNILATYQREHTDRYMGSDELTFMIKNFRDILIPVINAHLRAIYSAGDNAGITPQEAQVMFQNLLVGAEQQ